MDSEYTFNWDETSKTWFIVLPSGEDSDDYEAANETDARKDAEYYFRNCI